LLLSIFGALNSFEVVIFERTRAGLNARRLHGRVGGRPRSLDEGKLKIASNLMADPTLDVAEIVKPMGVAPSTLYRCTPGGRGEIVAAPSQNQFSGEPV
jgi:DNA invertase Pin-like site-specific DNA recombinase